MKRGFPCFIPKKKRKISFLRQFIMVLVFFAFSLSITATLIVSERICRDRVLPGVYVGKFLIGGMNKEELKRFLQDKNDYLVAKGLRFLYQANAKKNQLVISPVFDKEGSAVEMMDLGIDTAADFLLNFGKTGNIFVRGLNSLTTRFQKPKVLLPAVKADIGHLLEALGKNLSSFENFPQNAKIVVHSVDPLEYEISPSALGLVYNYEKAIEKVIESWSQLEMPVFEMILEERLPQIKEEEISSIVSRLPAVLSRGGLELAYTNAATHFKRTWQIGPAKIKEWIEAQRTSDKKLAFGLSESSVFKYLKEKVSQKVNVKMQNAVFQMDEKGRVIEFQGSRPGIELDLKKTVQTINQAIWERTWLDEEAVNSVPLVLKTVEPLVKTADVNTLGIKEILGMGITNYVGSPQSRVENIKNGANKLNGALIKPGEEFSALKYLRPLAVEGGYVEGGAIRGNEMVKVVGGGICHIATTLFRMAMNSGMLITQRSNHSLVLSFYNDVRNGLPGTDATILDPAPDFRFVNDTANNVLIEATVDKESKDLIFILWGKSDGRQGYYLAPKVARWITPGPLQIIKTADPDIIIQDKCQSAYVGADASFVYVRELANGKKEETTFKSHYRPLPEICFIKI